MRNINEAKTHLSEILAEVEAGEVVVLCKRNVPVAELRRVAERRSSPRPIGLAKKTFRVPATFFEPLPEDVERAFGGG